MIVPLEGRRMEAAPSARVAPNATLVGGVSLGDEASVWYGAVLRGDMDPIRVGARSAIEDNCVLHGEVDVGEDCIVGHAAVLHGCTLGPGVLVGMSATVLTGAVIGEGSIIGAGALVTKGTHVPPGSLVLGVPAKVVDEVPPARRAEILRAARTYADLAAGQLPLTREV